LNRYHIKMDLDINTKPNNCYLWLKEINLLLLLLLQRIYSEATLSYKRQYTSRTLKILCPFTWISQTIHSVRAAMSYAMPVVDVLRYFPLLCQHHNANADFFIINMTTTMID